LAGKSVNKKELARRYALAFRRSLKSDEAVTASAEFLNFADVLLKSEHYEMFISPRHSALEQVKTIAALTTKAGVNKKVSNFFAVITERGRIQFLSDIAEAVRQDRLKDDNKIEVSMTVASEMSDAEKADAEKYIAEALSAKPVLKISIDENILSGYVIRTGSVLIDNSLKTRLKKLHKTMKGVI